MERIATYKKTMEIIRIHDFRMKKNYGQNFLVDCHVLNKIIDASDINKNDYVIEIGPGFGGLTEILAEHAGRVAAIEIDEKLIPILEQNLGSYDNIEIVHADILKTDLNAIINTCGYDSVKVVANLPYYIATQIIMDLLEKKYPITSITIMVQKEVGNRLKATPGSKDYGTLSLAVAYYADSYLVANVPQNSFIPRPTVDSAVIRLTIRKADIEVSDEEFLFKIIKAAFAQRRKTLVNCLFAMEELSLTKEELIKIITGLGLSETIRGEALNLYEFALLSDVIKDSIHT